MPPSDQPAIPKRLIIGGWHAAQVFDGGEDVVGLSLQPRDQYAADIAANSLAPGRPVGPAVAAPLRHQHGITGGDVEAGVLHPRDGSPLKPGARPVVVDEGRERAGPGGLIEIALNAQPAALIADLGVRLLRARRARCQQRHKPGGRNAGDDAAAARHFALHPSAPYFILRYRLTQKCRSMLSSMAPETPTTSVLTDVNAV